MNYKLHVYLRHYIRNQETLDIYKKIVNRVNRATKMVDFKFSIFVDFDSKMSNNLKSEIYEISKKLIENNIEFSLKIGHGAGIALFNVMEEFLSNTSIERKDSLICIFDADAYEIDNINFLRHIGKLANNLYNKKCLIGLSQRSKIILGNENMQIYREINEIYFAFAMKPKLVPKKSLGLKIPIPYKEIGDPVPGLYCMNTSHPNFLKLFESIYKNSMKADMSGFAGDHYFVLAASQLGDIETEIIPIESNPMVTFNVDNISNISNQISKTDMRQVLINSVKSEDNFEYLKRNYPEYMVKFVRDIILNSIKKQ